MREVITVVLHAREVTVGVLPHHAREVIVVVHHAREVIVVVLPFLVMEVTVVLLPLLVMEVTVVVLPLLVMEVITEVVLLEKKVTTGVLPRHHHMIDMEAMTKGPQLK